MLPRRSPRRRTCSPMHVRSFSIICRRHGLRWNLWRCQMRERWLTRGARRRPRLEDARPHRWRPSKSRALRKKMSIHVLIAVYLRRSFRWSCSLPQPLRADRYTQTFCPASFALPLSSGQVTQGQLGSCSAVHHLAPPFMSEPGGSCAE